jgi:hypothetical protein
MSGTIGLVIGGFDASASVMLTDGTDGRRGD